MSRYSFHPSRGKSIPFLQFDPISQAPIVAQEMSLEHADLKERFLHDAEFDECFLTQADTSTLKRLYAPDSSRARYSISSQFK